MISIAEDGLGVYCGMIQKQLIVATCPLPQGTCLWKHRVTGLCTYNEETVNSGTLTPDTFARLVGLPLIPTIAVNKLRDTLASTIKKELT